MPAPSTGATVELLSAIRLACPSLPVGAFAYSQGLEYAVEVGWIRERESASAWISALLERTVARFDLPLLLRLSRAFCAEDLELATHYEHWVIAGRESHELRAEELHLGSSLLKLLLDLKLVPASPYAALGELSYLSAFALAGSRLQVGENALLTSYCFAWLEHQTSAVTRLVPLGQTDGQIVLGAALERVPRLIHDALSIADEDIGALAPGQALASALHETQYTRLFRS